jgi:hypothetical protein
MGQHCAVLVAAIVVLLPPPVAAQSLERLSNVLTGVVGGKADPRREPDWGGLQAQIEQLLEDNPGGDIAVLAQRAAADISVRISDPISPIADPASLSIDKPRFPTSAALRRFRSRSPDVWRGGCWTAGIRVAAAERS